MRIEDLNDNSKARTLAIVTCTKQKAPTRRKAKDLYASQLFKKIREYIELLGLDWVIISAKYGLVDPETEIESYEEDSLATFNQSSRAKARNLDAKIKELQTNISKQASKLLSEYDTIVLFCGSNYRRIIKPFLEGKKTINFFAGTGGIGDILKKLDNEIARAKSMNQSRLVDFTCS